MAHRNLTLNGAPYDTDDTPHDPFEEGSYDELSGYDEEPTENLLGKSRNYGESYRGYYLSQNVNTLGVTSLLGAKQPKQPFDTQNSVTPPTQFTRYPLMSNLRDVSSTSLLSQYRKGGYAGVLNNSLASSSNRGAGSDPFAANMDVSPFGGYPASQFPLHIDEKEADDYLHNPDPVADAEYDKNRFMYDLRNMDRRSAFGLVGFIFLLIGAGLLFVLLPVLTYTGVTSPMTPEHYEILTDYKYPLSAAIRTSLVDPDTPQEAYTKKTRTGEEWVLTFSDEFDAEGRTFYSGDDQFFEAVDLNYYATKDLEWYDPDAVTTANGTLLITMDAIKQHNLFYRSGMVQLWNKLCFSQGMIVALANLPHYGNISGLWPGIWTMGNLGRPGYLSTTEGVWPYTYDSCDAGITANQSLPDGISYLPGQKLNKCTCPGEDHPNSGVGRGAPEIDILEGAVDTNVKVGVVSQSYQIAPMDIWYIPDYNFVEIYNFEVTTMNTYAGGPVQQAVSAVSTLNTTWYERGPNSNRFQEYGFEYLNDDDTGYITWYVGQDPTFTLQAYAMGPNGNVGFRRISKEPMSVIMNLGLSNSWAYIDWPSFRFPMHMRVDYVRVYQPPNLIDMTCDPDGYPTTNYINAHLDAYMNVNHTSWKMAGYSFPKNRIVNGC